MKMRLLLSTIKNDCIETQLSLKYLYSIVEEAPIEVEVCEFDERDHEGFIYREIMRGEYNMIYFHCNMMNERKITTVCEMVKKALPTAIIIVGGMQVSFETRDFMERHPEVDYVFRGEGESVMFNFLRSVITYEFDFENIAGLAYRDDGEIIINPYDAPISFEDIPFPYERAQLTESDVVFYESFRGNPDRCAYSQYLPDRKIRNLSLNRVCTELRYFLVKNVKKVRFIDKWFNYNTDRAYRIWEYLINNDNGITSFEFDVNGDLLDEETIKLLSEAREGMFRFNIDVESTNAEALAECGRKENIYQLLYNVNRLIQHGTIEVAVTLRAGLPCETPQRFARSFNKVYALGADEFNVEVLQLKKGTKLKALANRYGYVFLNDAPYEVIANDFMPATELIRIKNIKEIMDYYVKGFEESLPRIMKETNIKPYKFFAGLTEYIYARGLQNKLCKKEHLYRILFAYSTVLYDEANNTLKLQILKEIIHGDLEASLPGESVKKFDRKGWDI